MWWFRSCKRSLKKSHSKPPKIRAMLIESNEPARKRNSVQSSRCTLVQKASEVLPRNSTQISIVCIRCADHMLPGAIAIALILLTKLLLGAEGKSFACGCRAGGKTYSKNSLAGMFSLAALLCLSPRSERGRRCCIVHSDNRHIRSVCWWERQEGTREGGSSESTRFKKARGQKGERAMTGTAMEVSTRSVFICTRAARLVLISVDLKLHVGRTLPSSPSSALLNFSLTCWMVVTTY